MTDTFKHQSNIKSTIAFILILLPIAFSLYEKDLGRDWTRGLAALCFALPFVYLKLPFSVFIYAALGLLLSIFITINNLSSPYVDDWHTGIAGIFIWAIIIPTYFLADRAKLDIKKLFILLFISALFSLYPSIYDLIHNVRRYEGFHGQPIPWGNLSSLTGFMLLAFAIYFRALHYPMIYSVSAIIGFFICMLALVISETRGAWPVFLFLTPILLYKLTNTMKYKVAIRIAAIACLTFLIAIPQTKIISRFNDASMEIKAYITDSKDLPPQISSLGSRFEFWKSATKAIKAHPFEGVGFYGFKKWTHQDPEYKGERRHGHPHNAFFMILLAGAIPTLCFILMQVTFLSNAIVRKPISPESELINLLAIILFVSFCIFSLTESFFFSKLGSSFYAMMSTLLLYLQFNVSTADE